jgi:hypothetical protein
LITYSFEPAHKSQRNGAGLLHTPLRFTTNLNMIWKAYANTGSALTMFCLLSLFEVVISKAIEQRCLHTKDAGANLTKIFHYSSNYSKKMLFRT